VKVKRQQQQRRKRLDARPQEALLCAKAKRQRQSELPGTEITSLNAPQHSQRFP